MTPSKRPPANAPARALRVPVLALACVGALSAQADDRPLEEILVQG
jgi:hypothetical protein